jgi:hypothetical protein
MRQEIVICDVCGERFEENPEPIRIQIGIDGAPETEKRDDDDVCRECRRAIRGAVTAVILKCDRRPAMAKVREGTGRD